MKYEKKCEVTITLSLEEVRMLDAAMSNLFALSPECFHEDTDDGAWLSNFWARL